MLEQASLREKVQKMDCYDLLLLLLIHLSLLSTPLGSNITSIDRRRDGDIVLYSDSCQTKPLCQSSGAICRQTDGKCACPENATFFNSKCQKKISVGCQYAMDYGENTNETYVPMMNLQPLIAAKQIGGLLQYSTLQRKKIGAFRSCTIVKSRSMYRNGGAWIHLFAEKRSTKDFTVESVGDSNHKVLRWNGAAHASQYRGFLVQLGLNCEAQDGQKHEDCLLLKFSGIANYLNAGSYNPTTRTEIDARTTMTSPSSSATKPETPKAKMINIQLSMENVIIIASSAGGFLICILIISIMCCCRSSRRRRGEKSKDKNSNNTEAKQGEDIELNVMEPNCSTQPSSSQGTRAAVMAIANNTEGNQSGSQNEGTKRRNSRHVYLSIRSKLRFVFRRGTSTSSTCNADDIYDYAFPDGPNSIASIQDDKVNRGCKTRPFSDDSEEYVPMNNSSVQVAPQLQVITEVEKEGNSYYELPVTGEGELYSYLQLAEDETDTELNEKNVAKLVSQFNKSLEVVCFPDTGRQSPCPSQKAKSQNNVHSSLRAEEEECSPLNPRMLTP
eukprot:Seg2261.1 transcript_id=Seg2261.1/GoldUCD/mRNA.D3Y31 product="hypothetical protein" protein_id=Seg2261.1/GoldUCD/D3Y31